MNTSQEQTLTSDAFLEGLADAAEPKADQTDGEAAEKASGEVLDTETSRTTDRAETREDGRARVVVPHTGQEGDGGDAPSSDPAAPEDLPPEGEGQKDGEKTETPAAWSVKHMGTQRTITAAEVTPELLQKGLDYDRVRERYNESKPIMEMFGRFAQKAGMSVTEYVRHLRSEAMRANGMSPEEAKREVELEDREALVMARESYQRDKAAVIAKSEERIQTDLADFARAFPEVYERAKSDPKMIPQKVWEDVNSGMSLTVAYSRYAMDRANEQLRAARDGARIEGENRRNAQRSTGSMRSAGSDIRSSDPFLEGFGA